MRNEMKGEYQAPLIIDTSLSPINAFWLSSSSRTVGTVLISTMAVVYLWKGYTDVRTALDLASTVAFGFTGALVSCRRFSTLTPNLLIILGFVGGVCTAVGGGTARTFLLGEIVPFWVSNQDYLVAAIFGAALAIILSQTLGKLSEAHWDFADRIALGVFVPIGVEEAVFLADSEISLILVLVVIGFGVLTGVGGGLIRDILLWRKPSVLVTAYGLSAAVGAASHLYLDLYTLIPYVWVISGLITIVTAEATRDVKFTRIGGFRAIVTKTDDKHG